ncbi:MAG: ammonia-forming cytochrome c nitrite reductase subunit c552 [Thermoplasmata archaeon]
MRKKEIAVMVSLTALVVLFLVMLHLTTVEAEEGTRGGGDYKGSADCSGCHSTLFWSWNNTSHSNAWDTLNNSSEHQDWCEVCHTTGANDTLHNGFNIITDKPEYLKNVQCEVCHGPAEEHISSPTTFDLQVNLSAELCSNCHRIAEFGGTERRYHPYYDEWLNSSHSRSLQVAGGRVVTDPECRGCHVSQVAIVEVFEGGVFQGPLDDPQPITCSTCHDPHGSPNPYQLRKPIADICSSCHHPTEPHPGVILEHPQSAMRNGTSDIPPSDVPSSRRMETVLCAECHMYATAGPPRITGHEFVPKPEACAVCHDGGAPPQMNVAESATKIQEWKETTHDYLFSAATNVTIASSRLLLAEEHGFSQAVRDQALSLFETANYSLIFVEADGSEGVHNPTYAWNLLNFSNEKANEVVSLLTTGTVVGKLKDSNGNAVAGAQIRRDGYILAVTTANGSFSLSHAPGVFTFEVIKDGRTLEEIRIVEVVGEETTDLGTVRLPPFADNFALYVIILVSVMVLVIFALAVYRYRHGKA